MTINLTIPKGYRASVRVLDDGTVVITLKPGGLDRIVTQSREQIPLLSA